MVWLLLPFLLMGCSLAKSSTHLTVFPTDMCEGNEHGYVVVLEDTEDPSHKPTLFITTELPPTPENIVCWLPGNRPVVVDVKAQAL